MTSRSVFVTGASRGIGAAIASELNKQGYRVVGTARTTKPEVEGVSFVECDVRDPQSVSTAVEQAREILGEIDIVVNCAGIMNDGPLLTQTHEGVQDVLDTNLSGSINVARETVSDMMANKWGRLVFVSSIVALWGSPGQVNYAASKSGLIGLARSLAWELGRAGITSNVVLPGLIETDMIADLSKRRREEILSQTALRRVGRPEEVAALIAFLVSDEAGFITGSSIPIGGGVGMGV
ncbi:MULTISPECIES: SDR family oxidoreductase [Streptomyces]|jgi:NAD(P)-dependent dehydrogenase (short-subunit alcohol dehydrogenase family)|uniref:SDR family oxidoreductase n=1 Tax=Streptomyces TaxID=1883 RepID=UPI000C1AF507|nr:SDR family oxidoreductase [Streptomyces sp. NBC_01549]MCX4593236.1 SDR family oxidoreductase [Streptomyces sp. NBC_01549]